MNNNDFIIANTRSYLCSASIPATLKRRRTAFSPNVANYASRHTA